MSAPQPSAAVVRAALIMLGMDTLCTEAERAAFRDLAERAGDHSLCRLGRLLK